MNKNTRRVEKLLDAFFEHNTVHSYPVIRIEKETRSTYDGNYPFFGIVYNAFDYKEGHVDILIEQVNKYTGLKEGKDYWLGITWELID
jgi:hypothetical protein